MSDTEIYNQKLNNMNFREKLRFVINTNQEVMDDQDNRIVKPVLDEEVYKHTTKVNKSIKEQWNNLGKEIKHINSSRYELPTTSGRSSPIPRNEDVRFGPNSEVPPSLKTKIPGVRPTFVEQINTSNDKLEEELRLLKAIIKTLNAKLSEKDTERKDIIDDFQAKEVRMMKNRQDEIKRITKRYENKILGIQQENNSRIQSLTTERDQLINELGSVKLENQKQKDKLKQVIESLSSDNEHLRFENNRLLNKDVKIDDDQRKFNQRLMIENKELKREIENMNKNAGIRYGVVQDDSDDDEDDDGEGFQEVPTDPRNEFKIYATKPNPQYDSPLHNNNTWYNKPREATLPPSPLDSSPLQIDPSPTEKLMHEKWNSINRDSNKVEQILNES